MNHQHANIEPIIKYPKYLFILILSYSMFVVMSNWYDSKIIEIFGISLTPGALVYSMTFLVSNMITEVYGFKNARIAIWCAIIFNILFLLYGWIVIALPSPAGIFQDIPLNNFISTNFRIVLASVCGYIVSEPINAYLVSKLKIMCQGKYIGIRFFISTITSGFFDSIFFITIAFYGSMGNKPLIDLMIHIWFVKTLIEFFWLPVAIRFSKKLKQIEEIDIYDLETRFTILSLNTDYTSLNNQYTKVN